MKITKVCDIPLPRSVLLFLIPYLVSGYDVIVGAVKDIFEGEIFGENPMEDGGDFGEFDEALRGVRHVDGAVRL